MRVVVVLEWGARGGRRKRKKTKEKAKGRGDYLPLRPLNLLATFSISFTFHSPLHSFSFRCPSQSGGKSSPFLNCDKGIPGEAGIVDNPAPGPSACGTKGLGLSKDAVPLPLKEEE